MCPERVQSLRSSVKGSRPTGRQPGELYVNFADRQIGYANASNAATDLVAVRYFATTADYVIGDFVVQAGVMYRAKVAVTAGAFNIANWDAVATFDVAGGGFVSKAGDTMTGALKLPHGTAAAPAIAIGEPNHGFYGNGSSGSGFIMGLSVNGGLTMRFAPTANISDVQLRMTGGSASVPGFAFSAENNTGFYWAAANNVRQVMQGNITLQFTSSLLTAFVPIALPGAPTSDLHAATKKYVDDADALKAPLASPVFTGNPTAPTPAATDDDTSIATTAHVKLAITAAKTAEARNRIVNGAMQISQEVGDSGTAGTGGHGCDQWYLGFAGTTTTLSYRSPTSDNPYSKYHLAFSAAMKASPAAGDWFAVGTKLEGNKVADFKYGTASAKRAVLSFTAYIPVAGTYCVAIRNSAQNRSGVFEYVISAGEANTWVTKSIVIMPDTTGTWLNDTGLGFDITWAFLSGTTLQGVAGWQAGNKLATANQTNMVASAGQTGAITNVGLYLDPNNTDIAPPFQVPDEAEELRACQRYYENTAVIVSPTNINIPITWLAAKRTTTAVTVTGVTGTGLVVAAVGVSAWRCTAANSVISGGNVIGNARM